MRIKSAGSHLAENHAGEAPFHASNGIQRAVNVPANELDGIEFYRFWPLQKSIASFSYSGDSVTHQVSRISERCRPLIAKNQNSTVPRARSSSGNRLR